MVICRGVWIISTSGKWREGQRLLERDGMTAALPGFFAPLAALRTLMIDSLFEDEEEEEQEADDKDYTKTIND